MNPYKFDIQQCMILFMYIFLHFARNGGSEVDGVVFRKVKNYGRKFNFIIFNHEYQHAIKYRKKLLCAHGSTLTSNLFHVQVFNGVRRMRMRKKQLKLNSSDDDAVLSRESKAFSRLSSVSAK